MFCLSASSGKNWTGGDSWKGARSTDQQTYAQNWETWSRHLQQAADPGTGQSKY